MRKETNEVFQTQRQESTMTQKWLMRVAAAKWLPYKRAFNRTRSEKWCVPRELGNWKLGG